MTAVEFNQRLRELLNREPFEPFIVEYLDGERFEVDGPHVAFSGGAAGFIGLDQVFFFDHSNVRDFLTLARGARS